jgi:starch-binding outer membrane protein, SusD/RagB family
MKIFILFIATIGTLLLFNACENIIEEKVYTELDQQSAYTSVESCDAALNGVYSGLMDNSMFGTYIPFVNTYWSVLYTRNNLSMTNDFTDGSGLLYFGEVWKAYYKTINQLNGVVAGTSNSVIKQTEKDRILGEAYFLRAVMYFDLVRYFGGVPIKTEPTTRNNINTAKSPADSVYAEVIRDIDKAKLLLVDAGKQKPGRPHKMAAYALAQKVYLTLAGSDPSSPYWKKSLDEGLVVYNSKAYKLVASFANLWNLTMENTTESVFEIQNSLGKTNGASMTRFFLPVSTLTPLADTWGRTKVNKEVFDKQITRYPNDPRIAATFLAYKYSPRSNPSSTWSLYPTQKTGATSFPYIQKYIDPQFTGGGSRNNFIYLRYADVLLMLAEAENEINGPTNAYKYVNEVLTRARGTGTQPANWTGLLQATFRDRIMDERTFELIGEMHDFFDARRRGKEFLKSRIEYHNTYPANVANAALEYTIATDDATLTRAMLLPIPLIEMTSNPLLKAEDQNPGY